MQQLTLRGFDPVLELRLRQVAKSFATWPGVVGNSVDHLIGVWSADDTREFLEVTRDFDRIDEEIWRPS